MATDITWTHVNATGSVDSNGAAVVTLALPATLVAYGAFAEPIRNTGGADSHNACTPTDFVGHSDANTLLLGTFPVVVGADVSVKFLFRAAIGQTIRAHIWTVTISV